MRNQYLECRIAELYCLFFGVFFYTVALTLILAGPIIQ